MNAAQLINKIAKGFQPTHYWIVGREKDKALLESLGVVVGPPERDETGQVRRAKGLITWGKCQVPDFNILFPYWQTHFIWGPEPPQEEKKG